MARVGLDFQGMRVFRSDEGLKGFENSVMVVVVDGRRGGCAVFRNGFVSMEVLLNIKIKMASFSQFLPGRDRVQRRLRDWESEAGGPRAGGPGWSGV